MRRAPDLLTADLFEVPVPVQPTPGALAVGPALRGLLSELLKRAPLSRFDVAARMSELTGESISKHQLDSWTAESREGWRFPLEYLPAFEEAIHTHDVTAWVAGLRGARLSVGREALEAQLGKVAQMRDELARQERALKKLLGEQG